MLYFLHIPKTAGSTLNYIIKNNYREKAVEIRWHWTIWLTKAELDERLRRVDLIHNELIHGHFVFGFHNLVKQKDGKYLTFVREPLKKVVSGFYHVKRDAKSQFHDVYKSKKIDDYLLDENIVENDNGLVRRLAGIGNEVPYGKVETKHLEMAIKNITDHFLGVGITERFDLSVEWFKSLGVFKNIYYWKQNTARNKSKNNESEITHDVLMKFKELNRFDLQLYAYCLEQFNKNTKNITFSQTGFNIRNRLYNMSLLPRKIVKKVTKFLGVV